MNISNNWSDNCLSWLIDEQIMDYQTVNMFCLFLFSCETAVHDYSYLAHSMHQFGFCCYAKTKQGSSNKSIHYYVHNLLSNYSVPVYYATKACTQSVNHIHILHKTQVSQTAMTSDSGDSPRIAVMRMRTRTLSTWNLSLTINSAVSTATSVH